VSKFETLLLLVLTKIPVLHLLHINRIGSPVLFGFISSLLHLNEASWLRVLWSFHFSDLKVFFLLVGRGLVVAQIMYITWLLPRPFGGHQQETHSFLSGVNLP
jgi:hypothetical protein